MLSIPTSLEEYAALGEWLQNLRDTGRISQWEEAMRYYGLNDLFFFVNFISTDRLKKHSKTGQPLLFHQLYLDLCKQVQWAIDNYQSTFDGSARRGSKSTIRTKCASIQMALRWPEIAICIFSVQKQLALNHLSVIKEELQENKLLKVLFSDVLYDDPVIAAKNNETIWSMDSGLRIKRSGVRPNQTFEANTFFGIPPTGSGFDVIHYDDCENDNTVKSQEDITKLHNAFSNSVMLATPHVLPIPMVFITNTFYHPEGIAKKKYDEYKKEDPRRVRLVPAENRTKDGDAPLGGTPIYPFTTEILNQIYKECGNKDVYSIQYCCDFTSGQDRTFSRQWVQFYDEEWEKVLKNTNAYLCIDASRGIYDPMAGVVWAAGEDKKLRWAGGFRKKLDPAAPQFFDEIFVLASKVSNLSNRLVEIRVEQMKQQSWADLIRSELRKRGMFTPVIPCAGKLAKDRTRRFQTAKLEREWQRWSPALQRGDILFPKPWSMKGTGISTQDENGKPFDLVDYFLDFEYDLFPRAPHDDVLDAGALIWEPEMEIIYPNNNAERSGPRRRGGSTWKSA